MQTSLRGINKRANSHAKHRFGGLYRLLNVDNLRWAFSQLNKRAASGVDRVTHAQYGGNLEENLSALVQSLKNKSYKAKLIRRTFIPKSADKKRPLGIPALEDKIVQLAAARILESIYEADFIDNSFGYRRGRGSHDAVEVVCNSAHFDPYNFVVEADIKGFFDNIDHEWLLKMLAERVDDRAFLGLIRKWLKAGVLEDGMVLHPDTGTPQGGVISPILANVYLHYALDLWFEKRVARHCRGKCMIVRYADDFVCLFQSESEARYFYEQLPVRLDKFNLEVAPEKTNLLNFSRYKRPDENGSFVFLGFEFRREISRNGKAFVSRKTAPGRLNDKITQLRQWMKKNRSVKLPKLMASLRCKFIGHDNYYGLVGNSRRLQKYRRCAERNLFQSLNRRSQKKSYNWRGFKQMLQNFQLPAACIKSKPQRSKQLLLNLM
jgi:RNA-directed DNA polymerase